MAILSGQNNNFRFRFPKVFVPEEIEKKFEPLLNRIPNNHCQSVIDFINYAIKSIDLSLSPTGYDDIEQKDSGSPNGRHYRSDAYPDFLFNREMTITFQLDQAYIIWMLMCDLFMYYYMTKEKFLPQTPGMEILDCYGKVIYRITFDRLLYKSISGLEFDFSSNTVDQKVITTTWLANKVDLVMEPSKV